jgi:hypothetical protein
VEDALTPKGKRGASFSRFRGIFVVVFTSLLPFHIHIATYMTFRREKNAIPHQRGRKVTLGG